METLTPKVMTEEIPQIGANLPVDHESNKCTANSFSEEESAGSENESENNHKPKPLRKSNISRQRNLSWNKDVRGNRSKGVHSKSGISSLSSSPATRRRYVFSYIKARLFNLHPVFSTTRTVY